MTSPVCAYRPVAKCQGGDYQLNSLLFGRQSYVRARGVQDTRCWAFLLSGSPLYLAFMCVWSSQKQLCKPSVLGWGGSHVSSLSPPCLASLSVDGLRRKIFFSTFRFQDSIWLSVFFVFFFNLLSAFSSALLPTLVKTDSFYSSGIEVGQLQ